MSHSTPSAAGLLLLCSRSLLTSSSSCRLPHGRFASTLAPQFHVRLQTDKLGKIKPTTSNQEKLKTLLVNLDAVGDPLAQLKVLRDQMLPSDIALVLQFCARRGLKDKWLFDSFVKSLIHFSDMGSTIVSIVALKKLGVGKKKWLNTIV